MANPNVLGSSSFNISGVGATTGSHDLGSYEMPVSIPILAQGNITMAVYAGIYDNGIISAPVLYPFYAPDTFTIYNAVPGHVYHHKPVYTYVPFTRVAFMDPMDDATAKFSNVTILNSLSDSVVYDGLGSGGIILSPSIDSVIALQTTPVSIVTNSKSAYVEMNYRLNNPNVQCDVSLVATTAGISTIYDKKFINAPIGTWNKVYLNFTNEIGGSPAGTTFQVQITGGHTRGQQDTVFLDDIKLLYFN